MLPTVHDLPSAGSVAGGTVGPEVAGRLKLAGDSFWAVVSLAETTSTNDVARTLAAHGAPEGTVVIADSQSSGRGRLGRVWHSPPGAGVWCSAVLRPRISLGRLGPLALVAAIGVHRGITMLGAAKVGLKWPNDILADGRKLGGILTEASGGGHDVAPDFVIVGVGVNVLKPEGGFPPPLDGGAITLADLTALPGPTAGEVGAAMLEGLAQAYRQFAAGGFRRLRDEWLAVNVTTGHPVEVSAAGAGFEGIAEDIDEYGRLLVRRADGRLTAVAAGDVTLRPDAGSSSVVRQLVEGAQ